MEEPGRTSDSVGIYMREMGNIPLLTRKEEIGLAEEIERGDQIVIKALSKTRFVQNEILSLEEKLAKDEEMILSLFDSMEEEFATGILEKKKQKILAMLSKIRNLSTRLNKSPHQRNMRLRVGVSSLI